MRRTIDAFVEHQIADDAGPSTSALAAAPWGAAHDSGFALYYPSGFASAELTLRHHLVGIEFLPNIVRLQLDGGAGIHTVVPSASFYFVPAGARVAISKAHACEYLLLTFDPDAPGIGECVPSEMREHMMHEEFTRRARDLRRELLLGTVDAGCVQGLASTALDGLSRLPAELGSSIPTLDWRLNAALDYIGEHFTRKISVEQIARAAGNLSQVRLSHLFSATFSLSVHQYVLRRRVHAARDRLLQSTDRIVDISHDTGFCNQPHMTEAFRRSLGASPAHIRDGALAGI